MKNACNTADPILIPEQKTQSCNYTVSVFTVIRIITVFSVKCLHFNTILMQKKNWVATEEPLLSHHCNVA